MTSPGEPEPSPEPGAERGDDGIAERTPPDPAPEATSSPIADDAAPERPASFLIRCPACGAETPALAEQAGKRGRCSVCGEEFLILPPPGFGPLPNASVDQDAPPFEGPPHRAQTVFAVGLAAILSTALATVLTSCCPYLPVDIVGVVVGLVATLMGRRDLKAMDRGEMDPAGRERTRLGFALGIGAAAISAFLFILRFGILAIAIGAAVLPAAFAPPPPATPPSAPAAAPSSANASPPKPTDEEAGDRATTVPLDVQGLDR